MQVEVGNVVDGKVTGITNFGAFIEIAEGKTGMVHISEISNSYVKEINDYLSPNQEVKVKVLSVAEDGKISLSIKQCEEQPENTGRPQGRPQGRPPERPQRRRNTSSGVVWQPKAQDNPDDFSFEDMMNKFKQVSNDRMSDLKRANEPKRSRRNTAK